MDKIKIKTGQKVKVSGQYKTKNGNSEITLVSGKKVPPTTDGETEFVLTDKTKHLENE